jgi:ASPIC and UnbV
LGSPLGRKPGAKSALELSPRSGRFVLYARLNHSDSWLRHCSLGLVLSFCLCFGPSCHDCFSCNFYSLFRGQPFSGPARLLVNNVGHHKPWIGFRMVGEKYHRDMLGTRVAVFRRNAPTLWRRVHSDGSYCSSHDARVLLGLGDAPDVTKIRAYWVNGRVEEWSDAQSGRYTTLREGSGTLVKK